MTNVIRTVVLVVIVLTLGPSAARSQSPRKYADVIANPFVYPDPCNNPTVRRWGPQDQKGNFNYITSAKILNALKLVREGRLIRLDHLLEPGRNGVIGSVAIRTSRATR